MNVVDLNKIILSEDKKEVECHILTSDDIKGFQQILSINTQIRKVLEVEEEASSFFKAYPDILSLVDKEKKEDLFYVVKLGQYYKGIPNKIVYILKKIITSLNNRILPNHIIEAGASLITPYIDCVYISEVGRFTFKDILENVCNQPVSLITDSSYSVKIVGEVYEVFIPDVERVALLPAGIAERLSYEDCLDLQYDVNLGIHLNGEPLRTWNNKLGVVFNDFDLVEVI